MRIERASSWEGKIYLATRVTQKRHIARNWLRWNVPKERGSIVARFFTYGRYRPEKGRAAPLLKRPPFQMVMIEKHTKEVPRLNHPFNPIVHREFLYILKNARTSAAFISSSIRLLRRSRGGSVEWKEPAYGTCVQVCHAKHLQPLFNVERSSRWKTRNVSIYRMIRLRNETLNWSFNFWQKKLN